MFITALFAFLTIGQVVTGSECSASWQWAVEESQAFTLTTCDRSLGPYPGHVPGSVHTDLIQAHVIPSDPYFRYLEKNLSWVTEQCWEYRTEQAFSLPQFQAGCDLHLRLRGLDAVSTVYLNDQEVAQTRNAHRDHDVIIPASLLSAQLSIRVQFHSALQFTKQQASAYPYTVPETQNWNVWAEPTSRNFLRKAGSDFGWDWGPAFVNTGISGGLTFYQRPATKLDGMIIQQSLSTDFSTATIVVKVVVTLANTDQTVRTVPVKVFLGDSEVAVLQVDAAVPSSCKPDSSCTLDIGSFNIAQPKLWWPRGYGEAHLYAVTVEVSGEKLQKKLGLRTVQLVQDSIPTTTAGSNKEEVTFYIKINGRSIFMRGANFIPIDSFHSRVSHTDRSYIFHAAAEANMNMLRVWGGGIYQTDDFYELADQFGMLIWQEVMLACALYPVDDLFLGEVEAEVFQQAVRLNTHPSIVVWGGNNENEVALYWFPSSQSNRDLYVSDYSKLYGGKVYPVLSSVLGRDMLADHVIWVDSSPSNGLISTDPYSKLWGQASTAAQGDVHFYDYNCDCEDYRSFPEAKFISEFGFQTMPSFETYEPVILPEDYDVDSPLLLYRQRHEDGNQLMEQQIVKHFHLPTTCSGVDGQQRVFDMNLFLTTIQQSRCYETGMNRWRQLRGIDANDEKYTMGILYWQLNDIWQGPSWASMEYSGRWKPLQYAVKRIYNMIALSFSYITTTVNGQMVGNMEVFVVNDFLDRDVHYDVRVELKQWATGASVATLYKDTVLVKAGKSTLITSKQIDATLLSSYQCSFATCYAKATATVSGASQGKMEGDFEALVATQPLTTIKDSAIPKDTNIQFSNFKQESKHEVSFDIAVNASSPFLFLEFTNDAVPSTTSSHSTGVYQQYAGWFSDNNFLAEAGVTYHLTYTSFVQELTVDKLQKQLQGRALQHVYNCQLPMYTP